MELFICSSNYQLLNAIMIVREYKLTADILITRESIWRECNVDVLHKNRIFMNIYKWTFLLEELGDENVKNIYDKIKIQLKKFITYLNKRKIGDSIPNKDKRYSIVHLAYVDSITLWVYAFFKKTSNAQLSLFEDGTYTYGCLAVTKTRLRRIAEKLLYKNAKIEDCRQIYVKHPDRIHFIGNNIKIFKINNKTSNEIIENVILPLYNVSADMLRCFKAKVLIFDQNIETWEVKKRQKEIAKIASDIFANSNVLIKLHPSSRDTDYDLDINIFRERVPFEIIMAYEQMDNKVLISIFSTACMSPKFDCDYEPYVIFTYRLFANFKIDNNYLVQIQQLKDSYRDKRRVMVPKTLEELRAMLEDVEECLRKY